MWGWRCRGSSRYASLNHFAALSFFRGQPVRAAIGQGVCNGAIQSCTSNEGRPKLRPHESRNV